jgi:hypothetical protein
MNKRRIREGEEEDHIEYGLNSEDHVWSHEVLHFSISVVKDLQSRIISGKRRDR